MPRPNWFIAFPLDAGFMLSLPALPPGFLRYAPEDVHLTLAFLGACGEVGAERAWHALESELPNAGLRPFDATLGEVKGFGSRRPYSTLSATIVEGREQAVAALAREGDLTMAASGRRSKRVPTPHVSLARVRGRAAEGRFEAGLAWARGLDLREVRLRLNRIALYTWTPMRRERLFRIVAERPLAPK